MSFWFTVTVPLQGGGSPKGPLEALEVSTQGVDEVGGTEDPGYPALSQVCL